MILAGLTLDQWIQSLWTQLSGPCLHCFR